MGRILTNGICRVVLLSSLLVAGPLFRGEESTDAAAPPASVTEALGCLVARDYIKDALKDLKLAPGRLAWVRYYVGTVPGVEPTPGLFHIAVYSEDGRHGYLLLSFRDKQRKFVTVQDGYRLRKIGERWRADMGNGGTVVYRAIGQFAAKLEKSPRYRVRLEPRTLGCAPPDE